MLSKMMAVCVTAAALILVGVAPATAGIDGTHQILNRQDPSCLTVFDAKDYDNADVGVQGCVNAAHQRWTTEALATGGVRLKVGHRGKCLRVQWSGNGYGSNIVQDDCSVATPWNIVDFADGWSRIETARPASMGAALTMCVDKSNAWDIVAWGCHNRWWQQWQSLG